MLLLFSLPSSEGGLSQNGRLEKVPDEGGVGEGVKMGSVGRFVTFVVERSSLLFVARKDLRAVGARDKDFKEEAVLGGVGRP